MEKCKFVFKHCILNFICAKEIQAGNFTDYDQYLNSKVLGASNIKEFELIQTYDAPNYEIAFTIERGGFLSYKIYEVARNEGYVMFEDFLNKQLLINSKLNFWIFFKFCKK